MPNDLDASGASQLIDRVPQTQGPSADTRQVAHLFAPFTQIGARIGGFGDALGAAGAQLEAREEEAGMAAARERGAGSVQRDADGTVTVGQFDQTTASGRAAAAAALQGGLAEKQSDVQTKLLQIRQEHQNDPAGYLAAAKAFTTTVGQTDSPEIRGYIRTFAADYADQHYRSLLTGAQDLAVKNGAIALSSRLEDTKNTLYALARQGGMDSPEAQKALAQVSDLYTALGQNPAYGYPTERVSSELSNVRSQAVGQAVVGDVDRTYTRMGKADAQKELRDKILNNPALNLNDQERSRLYSTGLARLDYLSGENAAQIAANKQTAKAIGDALEQHQPVSDDLINKTIATAHTLGDAKTGWDLDAKRVVEQRVRASAGLTDEERVQRWGASPGMPDGFLRAPPRVQQSIVQAADTFGLDRAQFARIAGIESRFDPNAKAPGSSASGLFQVTRPTGSAYGLSDPFDAGANAMVAAQITIDNRNLLRKNLGRDPSWGEIYLAHQQGAQGALDLLSNPDKPAVDVVGQAAVLGNGGTLSMTAGQFAQKWIRRMDGDTAGQPVNAKSANPPRPAMPVGGPPPAGMEGNPYYQSELVRAMLKDERGIVPSTQRTIAAMSTEIDRGNIPDAVTLAGVLQVADQFPEKLSAQRDALVSKFTAARDANQGLDDDHPGALDQALQRARALAQGGSLLGQQYADTVQNIVQRGAENLRTNPYDEAAKRGWIKPLSPLDFDQPASLGIGMDERSSAFHAVADRPGSPTPSTAFSKADMDAVRTNVLSGPPAAMNLFMTSLTRLDDQALYATLAAPELKTALASAATTRDPDRYRATMGGMDTLWRRNPQAFGQALGGDLVDAVHDYQGRLNESPDSLKKILTENLDAGPAEVVAGWRQKARTDAADRDARQLASKVVGSWVWGDRSPGVGPDGRVLEPKAAAGFLDDFRSIYQDRAVANRGNLTPALQQTIEKLGTMYGLSDVNNGTLMKFSPESTFKGTDGKPLTVNGSFDWVKDDIQQTLRKSLNLPTDASLTMLPDTAGLGGAPMVDQRIESIPYTLAPYAGTQVAITRGDPIPPYQLVYSDPRTGELKSGFYKADPGAALGKVTGRLTEAVSARKADDARNDAVAPMIGLQQLGELPAIQGVGAR